MAINSHLWYNVGNKYRDGGYAMLHKNNPTRNQQVEMISIDQLVPSQHLVRKIDKYIDFTFIYRLVEDKYSPDNGRPSIDPVVLMKLVILQYMFGIKSMRQTIKEVEVNLAYRWFLGLGFSDPVPHFSTFGQNYRRRFKDTNLFEDIFQHILRQAIELGMVDTKIQFIDSTHVKAHANRHKYTRIKMVQKVRSYQNKLDLEIQEDRKAHGKKELPPKDPPDDPDTHTKETVMSTSDPESGLFHKGEHKEVFAFSVQTSSDINGWILAYQAHPGNLHDSTTFFPFYEEKIKTYQPEILVMDAGYKIPAIAQTLLETDTQPLFPYSRPKRKPKGENPFYKRDFVYDESYDGYLCPHHQVLPYSTTSRDGYREYKSHPKHCRHCPDLSRCTSSKNHQKVVTRHLWQDAIEQCEDFRLTPEGKELYKKRKETIERQFGTAKEHHGFRYTNLISRAKMEMKAAVTFACLNMKKLALLMDRKEKNGGWIGNPA